jgi:hypothetical protein
MRCYIHPDHLDHRPPMGGTRLLIYPDKAGWSLLEVSDSGSGAQWLEQASRRLCLHFAFKAAELGAEIQIVNSASALFEPEPHQ